MSIKRITVKASRTYDVVVGDELLPRAAEFIGAVSKAKHAVIVTDDNVDALYSQVLERSLADGGIIAEKFVFPHGEQSKSHTVLLNLYAFLAAAGITRTDLIIALGGGVTGDLTGFAAATYLRGVDYVQIPTSLLAQVDSSVGGKTAVDIAAGKNLVGAFNQPLLVLCDTSLLGTLTDEFFRDGIGEVVKYGMIRSKSLFDKLGGDLRGNPQLLREVITECIEIKRDVVQNDEHDTGERMILNFGHTLGHAIEKYYNYSGITHGCGVAVGMALMTALSERLGLTQSGVTNELLACLRAQGLPYETDIPLSELYPLCLNDKKRMSGEMNVVICPRVGCCEIKRIKLSEFEELLRN